SAPMGQPLSSHNRYATLAISLSVGVTIATVFRGSLTALVSDTIFVAWLVMVTSFLAGAERNGWTCGIRHSEFLGPAELFWVRVAGPPKSCQCWTQSDIEALLYSASLSK